MISAPSSAIACAAAVSTTALAACGGSGVVTLDMAPPHTDVPRVKPPAADTAVVRRWTNALRAGHVRDAARWFGVPATVQTGTAPQVLASHRAALAFNRSLPCGAYLVRAQLLRGYLVATFLLRSRPGGACEGDIGHRAATAFRISSGRIVEWRTVPVPPDAPPPSGD